MRYILMNITKRTGHEWKSKSQSLTACEVASDGNTVVLGFTELMETRLTSGCR